MDRTYEAEIIRDVLLGDPQPFEILVREYQGAVYNLMLRSVQDPDTAADLAQDAFTKAYARLETFRTGKRFFPWLYSLALNVVRDHMRKNGRDVHVYMEDPSVMVSDAEVEHGRNQAERNLDEQTVFEYIEAMPPKYREALILRFRYDFSMQEIGTALGITVSGAKMRVSRGLDMVREQFKEMSDVQ